MNKKETPLSENLKAILEDTFESNFIQVAKSIQFNDCTDKDLSIYSNLYSIMSSCELDTVEEIVASYYYSEIVALGKKPENLSAQSFLDLLSKNKFGCIGTLQRTIPQIQVDFPKLALEHRYISKDKYNSHPSLFENVTHPALKALANYPHPENIWLDKQGRIFGKPYKEDKVVISKERMKKVFPGPDIHKESYLFNFDQIKARFGDRTTSKLMAWVIPIASIDKYKKRLSVDDSGATLKGGKSE